MAIYLDENYVGSDARDLVYPGLVLCMGVACQMSTGRLIGCHISGPDTEDGVLDEMRAQIEEASGTPALLYMIANFSRHFLNTKLSFTDKARKLGYTGNIYVLDTQPVIKREAAYARLKSSGGSAAM